jgi:two-component system OmpR family sensor kinase
MLRLFISLYLVIIVGIAFINWGSEYLWFKMNDPINHELTSVKQLATGLTHLINNKQQLAQVQQATDLAIIEIPINNIAWLDEQLRVLEQGQAVVNYDSNDQALIYVKSHSLQSVYQIGPLVQTETNERVQYFLLVISYLFLAGIIAFWTRPIWRDLQHLSTMVAKINNNEFTLGKTVNYRSPISPIVKTINHMALKINRLLSEQKQLVNAVSHELRTPLSRLRFSIALIDSLEEKQQEDLNQDISEIENLVDEMLGYSRLEHIAQHQKKMQINVSELLHNQIEKLQRGSHIRLVSNIDESILCQCYGDLLERASQNLITNAIRYARSEVIVSASISSTNLIIKVEDDGCGIQPEDRADLFKPFTRVDKSRDKQKGGYGLGLAIVKKAIDWHNGQCFIEDATQGGALFILRIPAD